MSSSNLLKRTYLLSGMDRVLYARAPAWREGTFVQDSEESGLLILHASDVASPAMVGDAIGALDRIAEEFRLAIAKRTGCPLSLKLEASEEPNFDLPGTLRIRDTARVSARAECTVLPRDPPDEIEQVPKEAARWIMTLTETHRFAAHPDEVIKRFYLLIEELKEAHGHALNSELRDALAEVKWIRDFVSHPTCRDAALCRFIEANLPSAVLVGEPLRVRFDRTNVEHRNFVGRYDPRAREIANALLNAAITTLRQATNH